MTRPRLTRSEVRNVKQFLAGVLAAALIVAGAPLRAQQKPNFSGDWKINQVKSNFGAVPAPDTFTRKIVHADRPAANPAQDDDRRQGINL